MDPHGHIYEAPADLIPLEDKARLDGYLKGRAEANVLKGEFAEEVAKAKAEMEERIREPEAQERPSSTEDDR